MIVFDEKSINLQRQGRLGTYASVKGQEACQIPSAIQANAEDLIFPAFREHGVFLARGIGAEKLFQYWAGDERGMGGPGNVFPVAITVGGHLPHAVGAAMAFKHLQQKRVAIVYFGDGATSEGDFHEAMNFAGVFKAPVIFICQNNQWAISTPVKEQTASATLAQKAIAYGFEGKRIDGNDVFSVYREMKNALEKARNGKGPTFIECLTYRMGDHTTSDDATRYRKDSEIKMWEKKDPILRFKKYLFKKNQLNEKEDKDILEKAQRQITEAWLKYQNMDLEKPEEIFNYTYSHLTPELKE